MPTALVGVFYDDGIYLALAKSLATGGGYRLHYLPGAPSGVHYPWGYPLFLAAVWKLWPAFPANVLAMRIANGVFLGAAAGVIAAHLAPRLPWRPWLTALLVALASTAIPMLAVATVLFSEPMFLLLAALALWLGDTALRREGRGALAPAVAAGVVAGAATLTRSIGVTVIGGIVLALLVRRRWQGAAAAAVPALLAMLPWTLWSRAHRGEVDPLLVSGYGTYGDFARQAGSWISLSSFAEVTRPLAAIGLPPLPGVLRAGLGLVSLGILLAGFVRLTRLAPPAGWMAWCYLGIVALWPYDPERFVWGVLPWVAVAFALGVQWAVAHARRPARILGWAAAATVAAGFGIGQVRGVLNHGATITQVGISNTMNQVLPWIAQTTDSSAVIAGEDEALIWLYTGRRAVPSFLWRVRGRRSESFGPDSLHAWLERSGATHLVLTGPRSEAAPTIDALLSRRRDYLQLVRVWPGQLYAFRVARGT